MIELSGRYVGGVSSKGITCGAWVLSVKLRVSLVVFWFGFWLMWNVSEWEMDMMYRSV